MDAKQTSRQAKDWRGHLNLLIDIVISAETHAAENTVDKNWR